MLERQQEAKAKGTNGNGFGLTLANEVQIWSRDQWRTPSDLSKRGGSQSPEKRKAGGHTVNLEDQAEHWSTPRASDGEKGGPNMSFGAGGTPLPTQAAHWPTPAAQNYKGSSPDSVTRKDGKSRMDILHYAAEQGFPHSPPAPPTPDGQTSSPQRRRLNPLFVEWLMGWPEGLSGFDTAATASCPSPRPSLGCGCMDCWLTTQRAMLSALLTIDPPAQASLL